MMRVTRKGVGAVPEPGKGGWEGEAEMNRYRDEDANKECERIETIEEVEARYGVPYSVVTQYLMANRGLFMALNPHTNVRMIVGDLPDEVVRQYAGWRRENGILLREERIQRAERAHAQAGSRNPLAFLWWGPADGLELVLWLLLFPLTLPLLVLRGVLWVWCEFESAANDVGCCKNYDMYASGDGLFDSVNDVRRADIEYLFGGLRK